MRPDPRTEQEGADREAMEEAWRIFAKRTRQNPHSAPIPSFEAGWQARGASELQEAARELADAARPYVENAAPHEQLFNGEDLRNFERLTAALAVFDEGEQHG